MPPARLPAKIDRSGLGGGSFFSPAPAGESALATGAVAAATEAIAEFSCLSWASHPANHRGVRLVDRLSAGRAVGWVVLSRRFDSSVGAWGPRSKRQTRRTDDGGQESEGGGTVFNRSDLPSQEG